MIQALFLLLIASAMHFIYDFIPYDIIGLIVPIDESIFQHIKLIFYPILFYYLYIKRWNTIVIVQLVSIVSMLFIYYFYRYALNIESVPIDILLVGLIFVIMQYIDTLALQHNWITSSKITILFIMISIFLLGYLTIYPPNLPMFIEGNPIK
ncbi:DUF6512 family protein [Tannockella kyphosi]|uniref:DUF6512 family protein n=1 Tax=Tannockella kyphosi TaxID=2899121 RepID=UPI002010ECCD|nr:DUF6512 family protein [Tannockella kyphosi]